MSTSYKKRKKICQRPNSKTAKEWREKQEEIKRIKGKPMGKELF